ncbi:MAG: hypothetical protein ABIO44_03415, partial [Saprospiraceae bacterium]
DYGIFKSMNSGETWTKVNNIGVEKGQGRIMLSINKNNPNKIYGLISDTFHSLFFIRSNDLLNNITIHSIPDIASYQGWYVKGIISNQDGKEVLIGGVDLFLDKTGKFNSFVRFQMGDIGLHSDFHDIIANPNDAAKVYFATDGGIFRSDDFGRSFYSCNSGLNTSQFYSASFTDNGDFGIGGLQDNRSAIYSGTTNWILTHLGDGTSSAINTLDKNIIFCSSQNLYLSKSIDKGKNWTNKLIDPEACFVTPFKMSPSNENVLYTGSTKLYKSTDNGNHFTTVSLMPDSVVINTIEVSSINSEFLLLSSLPNIISKPKLYKSLDGGKTLINITSTLPDRIISDICIIDNLEYIVSLTGFGTDHIYRTLDGGLSWFSIDSNLPDIPIHTIWVSPFNPDLIFAGSDLGLYFSDNKGKNWRSINPNGIDAISIYDLVYIKNERTLAILTHGRGAYKIDPFGEILNTETKTKRKFVTQNFYTSDNLPLELLKQSQGQLFNMNGQLINMVKNNLAEVFSNITSGVYLYNSQNTTFKILKYN